ncbi:MAG: site-specific integrase [Rhodocyclaceae bacterium]|nr:site-specific integrase [Rhodocyclaceae bacterium]
MDQDNIPVFYPTLFATAKIRNAGFAANTMDQYLTSIKVLLRWSDEKRIDLVSRILTQQFLTTGELDQLADECGKKRRAVKTGNVVSLKKGWRRPTPQVDPATKYIYIGRISEYLKWLSEALLAKRLTADAQAQIDRLVENIEARRVAPRGRNRIDDEAPKGITLEQEARLFHILQPESPLNPFHDAGVQVRNYLIVKLLRLTGMRGGEILNLKIKDIDWIKKQLRIIRRADTKKDKRKKQALSKTRQRALPLTDKTLAEIRSYIVEVRKHIPNSDNCEYLFVSQKSGPTQGQSLSLSSMQELFSAIRKAYPELNMTAHDLRHRWNESYSDAIAAQNRIGYLEAEKLRSLLAGWTPNNSQMGAVYNSRHIRRKAHEAMLATQELTELQIRERQKQIRD